MGIFDQVPGGKVMTDANYMGPGHYFVRIDRLKVTENWKGDAFFAVETTVCAVLDDADGTGHKPGEEVTHLMKRSSEYFASDVKKFAMAVLGCSEDEVTVEALEALTAEDQPLAGTIVEVQNRDKMTKGDPAKGKKPTQITIIRYMREVPIAEAVEAMEPDAIESIFDEEWLARRLDASE